MQYCETEARGGGRGIAVMHSLSNDRHSTGYYQGMLNLQDDQRHHEEDRSFYPRMIFHRFEVRIPAREK